MALSAIIFGPDAWQAWLTEGAAHQVGYLAKTPFDSWYLKELTTPYLGYGLAGWIFFAAAAISLLIRHFGVFSAATASFLISPYGFHYNMTVVCLGFGNSSFSALAKSRRLADLRLCVGLLVAGFGLAWHVVDPAIAVDRSLTFKPGQAVPILTTYPARR